LKKFVVFGYEFFIKKSLFFVVVVVFWFLGWWGRGGGGGVGSLSCVTTSLIGNLEFVFWVCHKRWWCWICGIGFLMMELGMSLGDRFSLV